MLSHRLFIFAVYPTEQKFSSCHSAVNVGPNVEVSPYCGYGARRPPMNTSDFVGQHADDYDAGSLGSMGGSLGDSFAGGLLHLQSGDHGDGLDMLDEDDECLSLCSH
jgi:hypothetical protein